MLPGTEELFDDPLKSSSSSSNLEDLALGNGEAPLNKNSRLSVEQQVANDDGDPWAVLAAAAGEVNTLPSAATTATPTVTLSHSEGESFTMPNATSRQSSSSSSSSTAAAAASSFIGQIRSSTTNLIQEVDAKTGVSTRARIVDDQLHISEKWTNFHSQILLPTTTKSREIVQEKIAPAVKEHWGSIQQRTVDLGVKERLANLSSTVGQTWHETTSRVGHWREEQEMKRAMANSRNESLYGDTGGSPPSASLHDHHHHQFQQNAKEKVVEGWNWLSQRIQGTKLGQQQQQQQPKSNGEGEETVPDNRTSKMTHLDSDGLPSSFRKD